MKELQNVLYVQTQGAFLSLDHDTVRIDVEGKMQLRAPLLRLQGIVLFGQVSITPFLIQRCAEDGRSLVWLTQYGRFCARVDGEVKGNVLLRQAQHQACAKQERTVNLARQIVAGKLQNSRNTLLRGARDAKTDDARTALTTAAASLATILTRLKDATDVDTIRGMEGEAASSYFGAFNHLITVTDEAFQFRTRTRRPPRDPTNAILSFIYSLLVSECASALESVGLDPQMGYLHTLRPGRPSLALDLLEELRAPFADRLALSLINRRQLQAKHFDNLPGGAVYLNDEGRRLLLVAYQERKASEVDHRVLKDKVAWGLIPQVQARLLARHLRGDLKEYPPFIYK